jgi:hypothetical protein
VRAARGAHGRLATGPSAITGVPNVVGVVTDAGEVLPADLVVEQLLG